MVSIQFILLAGSKGKMKYLIIFFIAAVVIAFILAMTSLIFSDASDTWRKLF